MNTNQPNQIVIRRALPAELEVVVAITDAAYARYVPIMGGKPQPMLTDYAPMIAEGQVWLLERDDQAVGVLVLVDEGDHLLIYSVALDPKVHKQGLGRRLLDWAEQQTHQKGYTFLRLYTNVLMTENQAIYKHVGYVETEREVHKDFSIVHMEKRFDQPTT